MNGKVKVSLKRLPEYSVNNPVVYALLYAQIILTVLRIIEIFVKFSFSVLFLIKFQNGIIKLTLRICSGFIQAWANMQS